MPLCSPQGTTCLRMQLMERGYHNLRLLPFCCAVRASWAGRGGGTVGEGEGGGEAGRSAVVTVCTQYISEDHIEIDCDHHWLAQLPETCPATRACWEVLYLPKVRVKRLHNDVWMPFRVGGSLLLEQHMHSSNCQPSPTELMLQTESVIPFVHHKLGNRV